MKFHCKKHLSIDENAALYPKVASGDATARDEMIVNNMPLVLTIVDGFIARNPTYSYLRDDLYGDGFLGLTEAVRDMARFPVKTPTAYLMQAIKHRIYPAAKHSPYRLSKKDLSMRTAQHDSVERVDVQDQLDSCCESDYDKNLLRLRVEGRTFAEIASEVKVARRTVIDNYHAILAKYRDLTSQNDV
jgi:hypothetical protein